MGSNSIIRSASASFIGQAMPLLVALITMPLVVRELGHDQFGILSIVWMVLGHFAIFDLGLGRAATRSVATRIGQNRTAEIPGVLGTACHIQLLLGSLGAIAIGLMTPLLTGRVLRMDSGFAGGADLVAVTQACLGLIALSVPLVLVEGTLRGGLEAHLRFDLINRVRIPISISGLLAPWLGASVGLSLPAIVSSLVGLRVLALLAYRYQLAKLPDISGWTLPFQRSDIRELSSFGVWAGISSAIGPLLGYLERFLIAGMLSVSALTLYALPMEALSRLLILPRSLASALFPALGELGIERRREASCVYVNCLRALLLFCLPLAIFGAALTEVGLELWAGPEFSTACTSVVRILIAVILLNSLALVPFSVVQGLGKPEWKARLDLVELPLFAVSAWYLIGEYGLLGAALAKLFVTLIDFVGLNLFALKITNTPWKDCLRYAILPAAPAGVTMLAFTMPGFATPSQGNLVTATTVLLFGLFTAYSLAGRFGFTMSERQRGLHWLIRFASKLTSKRTLHASTTK